MIKHPPSASIEKRKKSKDVARTGMPSENYRGPLCADGRQHYSSGNREESIISSGRRGA
jgi:hypothetical protein